MHSADRTSHRRMFIWMAALAFLAPALAAHDLDAAITLAAPAVVIRASYGGSEPVVFANVRVFAPDSPAAEFQTAVTDRRGAFSFVPNSGGDWRVIVDDDEGHRRELTISVPWPFESNGAPPSPPASRLERALLGISLLIGATGFLYGIKARRNSGRLPS